MQQNNFDIQTIINFSRALLSGFTHYFEQLYYFRFSWSNPVLWIFFLLLLLVLLRFWKIKKALSFCAVIFLILLATTKAEVYLFDILRRQGVAFDPVLFRAVSLFLLALVTVYYLFIRDQE
ncbi:MAG: hypothetical protein WCI77_10930 [Candidatus Omnitrophota bacterium]